MMMKIELDQYFIYITLQKKDAQKLNAVWLSSKGMYRLPKTLHALRELWSLGYRDPLIEETGRRLAEEYRRINELKNRIPEQTADGLRPYQQADVDFLLHIPHVGIFNQQRTGKTPVALKLIEKHGFRKGVIVCPATLVYNWEKEVRKWTGLNPVVAAGTKKKRQKIYDDYLQSDDRVMIISYDTLKLDINTLLSPTEFVILDEAHYICNHRVKRAKACYALGRYAKKRIALTGTPSKNKGVEVYGILHFLYPDWFPGYWSFAERYFHVWDAPWGRDIGKAIRPEELQEILNIISVQRKRSEVMKWIPPVTQEKIILTMEPEQEKAYTSMLRDFVAGDVDAPNILAQLTRLRQIALGPESLGLKAPSVKEEWLKEFMSEFDGQAVIFSCFSSYLEILSKRYGLPLIEGKTKKEDRQQIVEEFQAGKHRFLLANVEAAGTGLTLDQADTVVFLDRHFSPTVNEQAQDRIVPTTEESNQKVHIIDLITKDTVDEKIIDLLEKKENILRIVNNYRSLEEFLKK